MTLVPWLLEKKVGEEDFSRLARVMPHWHLACDGSTEPVSCPYPHFRAASVRRQEAAVRFLYGFKGSVASMILFSGKSLANVKNCKSVARRHVVGQGRRWHCTIPARSPRRGRTLKKRHGGCTVIAPSPRSFCMEAARAPYDFRGEAVETARQLHWDCTIYVQSPRSLCAGFTPACPRGPVQEIARCS